MAVYSYAADILDAGGVDALTGRAGGGIEVLSMVPTLRDFRVQTERVGTISDQVMFKADSSAPEQPFTSGLVWLLRRFDSRKAWEGYSDANGWYTATGLEAGVEYIAVAIDPFRTHKATAAGPVVAT